MTATVTLIGGPMDGWIVKPNAPALDPEWGAKAGHPGWRYLLRDEPDETGLQLADWKESQ